MVVSLPLVTINLVVRDGEKYVHQCLDSVKSQTYQNIEVNIHDNASTDKTKEIIKSWLLEARSQKLPRFSLIESSENLGMWPGQEELLKHSRGKYIVVLSVDVILDKNFVRNAVDRMEGDPMIGALQPKVYQYNASQLLTPKSFATGQATHYPLQTINYSLQTRTIDTCGFQIFRSRRLINVGHGEVDHGQFDRERQVFAVEGAVPVFQRQALESCRLETQGGSIVDKDFFWYGDDLDLAWRMRLFGWKQVYAPAVIAYHDRSTTKDVSRHWLDYFGRIKKRRQIPIKKRRLDWANYRLALIKNDHTANLLKDLPRIALGELMVLGYTLLFEPAVFLEFPRFFRLAPKMLRRRQEIMAKAKVSAAEIHQWMT